MFTAYTISLRSFSVRSGSHATKFTTTSVAFFINLPGPDLLPPSPPAEQTTTGQNQTGETSASDGCGDGAKLQIEHRASTHSPSFTLEIEENAIGRKRGVSATHTRRRCS